jgi:hypothetical protein
MLVRFGDTQAPLPPHGTLGEDATEFSSKRCGSCFRAPSEWELGHFPVQVAPWKSGFLISASFIATRKY